MSAPPDRRRRPGPVVVLVLGGLAVVAAFLLGRGSAGDRAGPPPGPVDVGFSQDMAAHHQQAVLMAGLAADRAGPAVKALAGAILVSQSQELGALQGWLRLWGRPAASATPMSWMSGGPAMAMPMPGTSAGPAMPGMASPEELTTLWGSSGTGFDVLFLRLMIRHHQGGVAMAGYAETHAGLDVVRDTARAMRFQQAEEIGQMRALLRGFGATPLPPP
jgi:uncharacterized protein (DUF305 family)